MHVEGAVKFLIDNEFDSVWTVSTIDLKYHPLKLLRVENGSMSYYDPKGSKIIARQQLDNLFCRNGAAYVMTRQCILDQKSIMGKLAGAYVMEDKAISIDTIDDLHLVEFYLKHLF